MCMCIYVHIHTSILLALTLTASRNNDNPVPKSTPGSLFSKYHSPIKEVWLLEEMVGMRKGQENPGMFYIGRK